MVVEELVALPGVGTSEEDVWAWRMATYNRTVERNEWIPEEVRGRGLRENGKQRQFLLLSDVREVFYGGAAGCGKSVATLIAATQYVDVPGYAALLLRENFGDLNKSGAWMDLSRQWWYGKGARFNERDRCWTFPSGATITFGYLDSDRAVYQYDGPSFHFIGIDELTQHTEWRYRFMFKPLRRPKVGPLARVPLRMRATSNPGNIGHLWVKNRFGCGNADRRLMEPGVVYVPATLDDNAGNMDVKEYRENALAKLDPITRAQRERGDWDAVAGGRFKREWFGWWRLERGLADGVVLVDNKGVEVERFRWGDCGSFQTCDPAASTSAAADYFVLSTWCVTPRANVVWRGCVRGKYEIQDQVGVCQRVYRSYRPQFVAVEEVLSQRALAQLLRGSRDPVMVVRSVSPLGKDKLARAAGAINLAASGRVFLPEVGGSFPLEEVLDELIRFTGEDGKDSHDDVVDCCPRGTMIRTADGLKAIEDVRTGDLVLTHMGRYRAVTRTMSRVADCTYRIRVTGRPDLQVTGNHKLLCHQARRRISRTGGLGWTPGAEWVSVDTGLVSRRCGLTAVWDRGEEDIESVDLMGSAPPGTREISGLLVPTTYGGMRISPTGNRIPRHLAVDEDFCRILGYYAAEGACGKHQLQFASSVGEPELHEMVKKWAGALGLTVCRQVHEGGISLAIGSVTLRNWFRTNFRSGDEKRLPEWVMRLPSEKQWAVLLGYLAGDGHYSESGVVSSTISRHLATQLYEISCRLGLPLTLRSHPKKRGRVQWHLRWAAPASAKLFGRTPSWMIAGKAVRWVGTGTAVADQTQVRFVANRLVGKIREIEKVPGPITVYNIAVAEDESYVANGTVVHNCFSYACEMLVYVRPGGGMGGGRPPVKHDSGSQPLSGLR